jgi:hypothetical protein
MNGESIDPPAPCANKNDFAAVFGPSTSMSAMRSIIEHQALVVDYLDERGVSETSVGLRSLRRFHSGHSPVDG